jgi:hypothetical protein
MEDKNTPAFPFVAEDHTGMMINMGMTLRDYFAAKALPSAVKLNTQQYNRELGKEWFWDDDEDVEGDVEDSYIFIDKSIVFYCKSIKYPNFLNIYNSFVAY